MTVGRKDYTIILDPFTKYTLTIEGGTLVGARLHQLQQDTLVFKLGAEFIILTTVFRIGDSWRGKTSHDDRLRKVLGDMMKDNPDYARTS